jgi:hypothetical protein
MGTRNEELADYFIKAAGIAAVKVGLRGTIGLRDAVGLRLPPAVLLCCERGKHTLLAVSVFTRMVDTISQEDTLARLRKAAAELLVAITPHEFVTERALAVAAVNNTMHEMQQCDGRLGDLNRARWRRASCLQRPHRICRRARWRGGRPAPADPWRCRLDGQLPSAHAAHRAGLDGRGVHSVLREWPTK